MNGGNQRPFIAMTHGPDGVFGTHRWLSHYALIGRIGKERNQLKRVARNPGAFGQNGGLVERTCTSRRTSTASGLKSISTSRRHFKPTHSP
jgi:hypothetical protein